MKYRSSGVSIPTEVTGSPMTQTTMQRIVKRRFGAQHLENSGTIENARAIAGHNRRERRSFTTAPAAARF